MQSFWGEVPPSRARLEKLFWLQGVGLSILMALDIQRLLVFQDIRVNDLCLFVLPIQIKIDDERLTSCSDCAITKFLWYKFQSFNIQFLLFCEAQPDLSIRDHLLLTHYLNLLHNLTSLSLLVLLFKSLLSNFESLISLILIKLIFLFLIFQGYH